MYFAPEHCYSCLFHTILSRCRINSSKKNWVRYKITCVSGIVILWESATTVINIIAQIHRCSFGFWISDYVSYCKPKVQWPRCEFQGILFQSPFWSRPAEPLCKSIARFLRGKSSFAMFVIRNASYMNSSHHKMVNFGAVTNSVRW